MELIERNSRCIKKENAPYEKEASSSDVIQEESYFLRRLAAVFRLGAAFFLATFRLGAAFLAAFLAGFLAAFFLAVFRLGAAFLFTVFLTAFFTVFLFLVAMLFHPLSMSVIKHQLRFC